jgi:NAD(P)-dependent dehydrogenase (short-subunit alcohol dehydrogenase family)
MPNVLITGAGRGIGRVTALRLARAGWDVFAGVRNAEHGTALAAEVPDRITPVHLDVTSADDIASLDTVLPAQLDGVVNNAGYAAGGPVEALPIDEWRRQFEVNLFGQIAVTQAVLPRLRETRGRIVFVSSLSGRVSTPMTGAYNASKFAVEGMADALRMELRPWRIKVALIEPAQTDTDIWRDADASLDESLAMIGPAHRKLYAKHIEAARKGIPRIQKMLADPEGVAAAVERALTARRPRARYLTSTNARAQAVMARWTPRPVFDAAISKALGVPRRP